MSVSLVLTLPDWFKRLPRNLLLKCNYIRACMINLKIMKTCTNFATLIPSNNWSNFKPCITTTKFTMDPLSNLNFHWPVLITQHMLTRKFSFYISDISKKWGHRIFFGSLLSPALNVLLLCPSISYICSPCIFLLFLSWQKDDFSWTPVGGTLCLQYFPIHKIFLNIAF